MERERGPMRSIEQFAQGIVDVANAVMEKAIRVISVERGHDPRDYTLVAFGGAGALHACDLAASLEIPRVLVPCFPGALSALGILRADVTKDLSRTIQLEAQGVPQMRAKLDEEFAKLERNGLKQMRAEGFAERSVKINRSLDMRYSGQSYELAVPFAGDFIAAFHRAHEQRYGYSDRARPCDVVNVRARFTGRTPKPNMPRVSAGGNRPRPALSSINRVSFEGRRFPTAIYDRAKLRAGNRLSGPAIVNGIQRDDIDSSRLDWPRRSFRKYSSGASPEVTIGVSSMTIDPIRLEIFKNLFHSVAEEMGAALRRSAFSPNIKERRDYSCAVFDAAGQVLAMGDHMPVHLGSMPMSVAAALSALRLGPGDVALLNDPYAGGTHLPDLTMVMPVYAARSSRPLFYIANRAHHADIGGAHAGSMGLSREIFQEGLRVPPVKILAGGRIVPDVLSLILANVRTPREREGDLTAQIAACRIGERRLTRLVAKYGRREVIVYGRHLLDYSARMMAATLATIPNGASIAARRFPRRRWHNGWRSAAHRGNNSQTRAKCGSGPHRQRCAVRWQRQCRRGDYIVSRVLCFSLPAR